MGNVYWIGEGEDGPVKVGWSAHHPAQRLAAMQTGNAYPLKLLGLIPGPRELEFDCHKRLEQWQVRGEWFLREPALDLLIDLGRIESFDYAKDAWRLHT